VSLPAWPLFRCTLNLCDSGSRVRLPEPQWNYHVGEVLQLQVIADFHNQQPAGVAAYLTVPEDVFQVQDLGLSGQLGTQPFRAGPLLEGSVVATNHLLPEGIGVAAAFPGQQLDLAAVVGPGSAELDSQGVVATFSVIALQAAAEAVIEIDDNPIRETRMVLSDGRSERRFISTEGLTIRVVDPTTTVVTKQG
jgi:hypothetical protein